MKNFKNVLDMNRNELLEYLQLYTYTDFEYKDILSKYKRLNTKLEKSKQNKLDTYRSSFENWDNAQRFKNKREVENEKIPKLKESKKKHEKKLGAKPIIPTIIGIALGILAVMVLQFFYTMITETIGYLSGNYNGVSFLPAGLSFLVIIAFGVLGFMYHILQIKRIDKKIDTLRREAVKKDDEQSLSAKSAREQYGIDNYLNETRNEYNEIANEMEKDLKKEISEVENSVSNLNQNLPTDFQDYKLTYVMYKFVENGMADNWKEAANLYLNRKQHQEVMQQLNSINETMQHGFNIVTKQLQEQTLIISNIDLQVNKVNDKMDNIDYRIDEVDKNAQDRHQRMVEQNALLAKQNERMVTSNEEINENLEEINTYRRI